MMELVNDFGWKIFSGNRTVVDLSSGLEVVAGSKAITIKTKDIEKYPKLTKTAKNFADRTSVNLDQDCFDTRKIVPIGAICVLKLEPGADRTVLLNHPASLHTLFPYFLDTVYADTVMCDGNAVYQGEVAKNYKEKLANDLRSELINISVYSMAGSAEYLAKEISGFI